MTLVRGAPDLDGLELLVTVADEGGIGAAARTIGVSQPTASERLRLLERRLGLSLVVRTRTGSHLTSAGVAVADWARPVLEATNRLVQGAATLRSGARTRLAISASLTVAEHLVPRWLVTLSRTDPDVAVSLRMGNSTDVAAQVRSGTAQLGFVEGASAPSGLRSRTVVRDELALVVPAGHPWARRRRPVASPELATTGLVMRETGSGTREVLEQWMTVTGHEPRPVVELASTTALVQAVLSGAGPAVVSVLAVRAELADGRLVRVPLADAGALRRRIRAVWLGPGHPPGAAERLVRIAIRSGQE